MKKMIVIFGMMFLVCSVSFATNPVTVGSSGDFTTIQAAIDSWCAGGANAAETPPFIINVDPASGPYDEAIILQSTQTGHGDIVGSIVIQSATPGTYVHIKAQDRGGTGDGIMIHQNTADVTFKDLLIYPSMTNAVTDDLIKIDEDSANTTLNTFLFENVIITEIDNTGVPLITSKSQAFAYPTATVSTTRNNSFASLFQAWNDAGESSAIIMKKCCVYGNIGASGQASVRVSLDGGVPEEYFLMENCIVAFGNAGCIRVGGQNAGNTFTFTGTDQTAGGIDNCNYFITKCNTNGGSNGINDAIYSYDTDTVAGTTMLVEKSIFISLGPIEGTGSIADKGIYCGPTMDLTVKDCIFSNIGDCIQDTPDNAATFDRVTFHNISDPGVSTPIAYNCGGGAGSLTIRDCIFSGPGAKIAGTAAPSGGIDIDYCGFPVTGPDAITSRDDSTVVPIYGAHIVSSDPEYVSKDCTSGDAFDVNSSSYYAAGSGSADLAGGADFVGSAPPPVTSARIWSLYE
jgi:hypothetical protein